VYTTAAAHWQQSRRDLGYAEEGDSVSQPASTAFAAPSGLDANLQRSANGYTLALSGRIDERAGLVVLAERISNRVVVDLDGVSLINSMGLREWINFLRALEDKKVAVVLRRLSDAMLTQLNLIEEAARGVEVESFSAPYLCEGCDREQSVCVDVAEQKDVLRRGQAPASVPCPSCAGDMVYDGIPEQDFLFLGSSGGGGGGRS
jgi:anti-anti-sigma regulatory factor